MLKRSYSLPEASPKAKALAEKVTLLVAGSNVTYKEAMDALEITVDMLETQMVLVTPDALQQSDSELRL